MLELIKELTINIIAPVGIAVAIFIAVKGLRVLSATLRANNHILAAEIVEEAVRAAEQMITGAGQGSRKFEWVIGFVREALEQNKITLTDDQIGVLIESAVQIMNEGVKE